MLNFQRPGAFFSPASHKVTPYLPSHSRHVVIYHLLTKGLGYAQVEGDDRPLPLATGDIVIFSHGDPHTMRNGPPVKPVNNAQELQRVLAQGLKLSRMGGGRETIAANIHSGTTLLPGTGQISPIRPHVRSILICGVLWG